MKRNHFLFSMLCVITLVWGTAVPVMGQTFEVSVQNESVQPGGVLQFDIVVAQTGTTAWRMADATFQLTYNAPAFTSVAVSYVSGSTQLGAGYAVAPDISTARINVEVDPPTTWASSTEISPSGTRIGTFRVSTIANAQATANLAWRTPLLTRQVMLQRLSTTDNTAPITVNGVYVPPDDTPLPITLSSFTLKNSPTVNGIELAWTTVSEINNYGFYIQRRAETDNTFADLPESFIPGHGTTLEPQHYSYTDRSTTSGTWYYRLRQVDLDGAVHYSDELRTEVLTSVIERAPRQFALEQNYPNPFNPSTEIKFSVEATDHATVRVYNMLGQHVATLFDDVAEVGRYYRIRFEGTALSSGVYFYHLQSGKKSDLRKLVLLR